MGGIITNPAELEIITHKIPKVALEYVSNKAIERLKQIIKEQVYDRYTPRGDGSGNFIEQGGGAFGRSMNFEEDWGKISETMNQVVIGYIHDNYMSDPSSYIHGSPSEGSLEADQLADYIFQGYRVFGGLSIEARDAWSIFVNEMDVKVPLWIREGMAQV